MLPEEDHGELHRLAGETRMTAADLMRLGLRRVLANRDVLQRLPAADQHDGGRDERRWASLSFPLVARGHQKSGGAPVRTSVGPISTVTISRKRSC